jgi:protein TonB
LKRLILPIFLSLGIHAFVMSLDTGLLTSLPPAGPHPRFITISLSVISGQSDKKTDTLERRPETMAQKVKISEEKEAQPSPQVVKKTATQPEPPELSTQEAIPGARSFQKQMPVKKETAIDENIIEKKIKPKKSLKKMTKKQLKDVRDTDAVQSKPAEKIEAISTADPLGLNPMTAGQGKSQSDTSDAFTAINRRTQPGRESHLESASGHKSTALATERVTSSTVGLVMAKPLYRKNPPPRYPRSARRKGHEGTVILEVFVDETGRVKNLKVFKSSGYDILDKTAVSSVQKWLFEPGTRNGKAAEMWVRIPVRFQLN